MASSSKACIICTHVERESIDAALRAIDGSLTGNDLIAPHLEICSRFTLSRTKLAKHHSECIATRGNARSATPPSGQSPSHKRVIGDPCDELRISFDRLTRILDGDKLSIEDRLKIEARRQQIARQIERYNEGKPIDKHPGFNEHIENVLDALDATLEHFGIDPQGEAREVFAKALIEAEKAKDKAKQREAA